MVKTFKILSRAVILMGASTLIFAASSFLAASSPYAANVCEPSCPKGQICVMKKNGDTYCKTPEIVVPDCGNDPLCGLDKRGKRQGPKFIQN